MIPPFNAVILGEQSASLINFLTANPYIATANPLIANLAGRLDYYQRNPDKFVPVPIVLPTTIIDVPWGDGRRVELSTFKCNTVAMRFTVPASPANYATPGYTSMAEYQGPPTLRQASLSEIAGDFGSGALYVTSGVQVTVDFNVGAGAGALGLVPGRTYYINFRNWDAVNFKCSCDVDSCSASFSTNWPH